MFWEALMRALGLLLSVVLLSFCTVSLNATTIHVPADQPTIQAGINAAVNGDTVLVADGIYTGEGNRDIDFLGKVIVVMSENGPENCIIDCEGSEEENHRGFYVHSKEISSAVIQGFTIQNGYASGEHPQYLGGAIYCDTSSVSIIDNIITYNTAQYGGGIFCRNALSNIIGNTITDNVGLGGGIYCSESSPNISGNTITFNLDAGIRCYLSSPTITSNEIMWNDGNGIDMSETSGLIMDNIISGNNASGGGGGISCVSAANDTIIGNIITGNTAGGGCSGGGIKCNSASPIIKRNTIAWNEGTGGGIYCFSSAAVIEENLIFSNTGDESGGVYFYWDSPTFNGNTITGNTALGFGGGGIYCYDVTLTITNSILWGNLPDEIYQEGGSNLTVRYSDIEGGWEGEGNINEDPLFVDPENYDYHLNVASPCINVGDPEYVPEPGEIDIDGEPRVMRGRIDMGSDEVPYPHHKEAIQVE
jgi:parallel beta-helix repeat protein